MTRRDRLSPGCAPGSARTSAAGAAAPSATPPSGTRGRRSACPRPTPRRSPADLPGGQEEWLAALAAALWPGDEYAAIITGTPRKDRP